jgi:hypothetical protein
MPYLYTDATYFNIILYILKRQSRSCPGVSTSGRRKGKLRWCGVVSMYFVYRYENRTMKHAEIVLKRGEVE